MIKKHLVFLIGLLIFSVANLPAGGFDVLTFYPSIDPEGGITSYSTFSGRIWKSHMLVMASYEKDPLMAGSDRRHISAVIPHLFTTYFGASLNLPYKFQTYLLLPWNSMVKITDFINGLYETTSLLNNVRFGLKYSVLPVSSHPGFALLGEMIVPSGSPQYYLGSSNFEFKFSGITDFLLSRTYFYLNLSYVAKSAERVMNLNLDDELQYILGLTFPKRGKLSFTAEINGLTGIRKPFHNEAQNPMAINFLTSFLTGDLRWGIGAGTGITRGVGAPSYRIFAFISTPSSSPEIVKKKLTPRQVNMRCLNYYLLPREKRDPKDPCIDFEKGYIVGMVTNFSDFPIGNVTVMIKPGNIEVKADSKGRFVAELVPGIYYIKANLKEFTSTEAFLELHEKEIKKVHLRIKYLEGTLTVKIFNSKLRPIEGEIKIYSGTQLIKKYHLSENGGFLKLPPGTYIVEGWIPGYKFVSKVVEVLPGREEEVDLILR